MKLCAYPEFQQRAFPAASLWVFRLADGLVTATAVVTVNGPIPVPLRAPGANGKS